MTFCKHRFWTISYSYFIVFLFSQLHSMDAFSCPQSVAHKNYHFFGSYCNRRHGKDILHFTVAASSFNVNTSQLFEPNWDFNLLFESIVNYKRIFGSLLISKKFTVPQDSNWPPKVRGFRLGKQLEDITRDISFREKFPNQYQHLFDLGVVLEKNKNELFDLLDDRQMLIIALRQYKSIFGDLNVDPSFVIPDEDPLWDRFLWGLRLGNHVSLIRRKDLPLHERLELDSVGFVWNTPKSLSKKNDYDAQIFRRFCDVFKLIGSGLNYDSQLFPPGLTGFPFEKVLSEILKKGRFILSYKNVETLCDLNFDWGCEFPLKENSVSADDLFRCILFYGEHFNSFRIPKGFSVPSTGNWPASCRGINLFDLYRSAMKYASDNSNNLIRSALQSFPLMWQNEIDNIKIPEEDEIVSRSISNGIVESEFVPAINPTEERVPFHPRSRYPLDTTFMFENIKYREHAAQQIIRHKTEKMHVNSPNRFSAYFDWELSPHQVGQLLAVKIPCEEKSKAEVLGYRFIEFGQYSWETFLYALEKFKQHYGHVAVPIDYKISPDNFAVFSNVDLAGMELGLFCQALRHGDFDGYEDPERKKILDQLGFEWGNMNSYLRFRFFPFVYSLRIQHQMGGFHLGGPPLDFTVSDDLPYFPFWLRNVPVGQWYQMVKVQRPVLEKYFPDRIEVLNTFDFQWWWPFPEEFLPNAQKFIYDTVRD